jgi:hypothetical protein
MDILDLKSHPGQKQKINMLAIPLKRFGSDVPAWSFFCDHAHGGVDIDVSQRGSRPRLGHGVVLVIFLDLSINCLFFVNAPKHNIF